MLEMKNQVSRAVVSLAMALSLVSCASRHAYPSAEEFFWDEPATGWYWVPEGVEPTAISQAADECGALVDGSVANHGIVPAGTSVHIFHFVGDNTVEVRQCTVARLGAIPQLTTRIKQ